MKLARFVLFACLWPFIFQVAAASRPAKQFIVLSDIHFNPLADPSLAPQLIATEPSQWEPILIGSSKSSQRYGEDSTWPLVASLISELQTVEPHPKLIVVTGDILPHKFQDKFALVRKTNDPEAYRAFVKKTFSFVALELEKASGGAPVIFTPGNNDADCGDYALTPNGSFLKDTAETVQHLAHSEVSTWLAIGSYAVPNPLVSHNRILALNTSFWSRRYANSCGDSTSDPGLEVLNWLTAQLKDAREHGDKVWLVYHIPPGIDGHSSARTGKLVSFWKPTYFDGFSKLLDEYHDVIQLNLASHTHLDDFRLVKTSHSTTLVLMNPALSPNIGQNPAFRLIDVDTHGKPEDLTTYFMPDLTSLKWQLEYSARPALGLKRIDAESYEALYKNIGDSQLMADKWKLYYAVSRPEGLDSDKAYSRSLYCATGHADPDGFQACLNSPANASIQPHTPQLSSRSRTDTNVRPPTTD